MSVAPSSVAPDYWATSLGEDWSEEGRTSRVQASAGDYVVFLRDGSTPIGWGQVDSRNETHLRFSFDVPARVKLVGMRSGEPLEFPALEPLDPTVLEATLRSIEQFVGVSPPLPDWSRSLSPSASAALNSALGLARSNGQQVVHMEHLLAGLAVKPDGRMQRTLREGGKEPDDILTHLEEKFETILRKPGEHPPLEAIPRLSPHALEALLNARRIAEQTNKGYIQHHVLTEGALEVSTCEAVQVLEDLLRPPGTKKRRSGPQLARFLSDTAHGKDQLDIEPYAQAMALLLINREVEPPLSVGLFGDWGSGKSFFMARVEHWVREYGNPINKKTCCSQPVQIRFNAWQYVDADLWSSLVVHILDRISGALTPKSESPDATRRKLIEQLGAFGVRKSELELELEQARLAADEVRKRAETAAKERSQAQALLDAAETLGVLDEKGRKSLAKDLGQSDGGFGLALKGAARSPWTWTLLCLAILFGALGYFERIDVLLSAVPLVGVAWKVLTAYTRVRQAVNAGVKAETTPHDQAEIDRLERVQHEAQATLNQLEADRARLEAKVEKIDPRARLLELLERRTAYEKSQGLIAQVHTDFQRLEDLIAEVQETASGDDAHVERIVLYIDDLDRCPPKRVVEVLQAVHLLLAFKLFVVVVAVDPRWLRRALEVHFPDLLLTEKSLSEGQDHQRRATPRDYLEKIFQIPFTLPPLEASIGGPYLASLTGPPSEGSAPSASNPSGPSPAPLPPPTPEATPAPGAQPIDGPERKTAPTKKPEREPITPDRLALDDLEREAIQRMAPFFTTPRAAKRFVNVYRLLRATATVEDETTFLGTEENPGDYGAAVLLCAVGIRFPELLTPLEAAGTKGSFRVIAESLKDRSTGSADLLRILDTLEDFQARPAADFAPWFEPVRRFAFNA